MAIDKIQSESINLADNFAFTGTVSGAGTHNLLGSSTVSSSTASVTFTSSTFTGFDIYMVEGIMIQPVNDNVKLRCRVAGADGVIDTGSIYNYAYKGLVSTGGDVDNGNQTQAQYLLYGDTVSTGSETDEGLTFRMWVSGVADSTVFTQFHSIGVSVGSNYCVNMSSACNIYEANTTTKLQFDFSSGNIAKGTFKIYGVS